MQDRKMQKSIIATIAAVLKMRRYLSIAAGVTGAALLLASVLPGLSILKFTLTFPGFTLETRLRFFFQTLFSFSMIPGLLPQILTLLLVISTGVYTALLVYFLSHRIAQYRAGGLGYAGIVLALLGIGCTACGSVIFVSLLGLSVASALLGYLPLRGAEFMIAGNIILLASIYFVAKNIRDPQRCKLPR